MAMDNCAYNKIKILHEISKLAGFIETFAKKDAKSAKHMRCHQHLEHLHRDLQEHMEQLRRELAKKEL